MIRWGSSTHRHTNAENKPLCSEGQAELALHSQVGNPALDTKESSVAEYR